MIIVALNSSKIINTAMCMHSRVLVMYCNTYNYVNTYRYTVGTHVLFLAFNQIDVVVINLHACRDEE